MALHYSAALQALREGDAILQSNPDPMKPDDRPRYALVRGGKAVDRRAFRRLLPDLAPRMDGLFEGDSQTWELRQ